MEGVCVYLWAEVGTPHSGTASGPCLYSEDLSHSAVSSAPCPASLTLGLPSAPTPGRR